jgi:hypothetical protein
VRPDPEGRERMANPIVDDLDKFLENMSDSIDGVAIDLEEIDIYAADAEDLVIDAVHKLRKIRDNIY